MRLAMALGAAFAFTTISASAQDAPRDHNRTFSFSTGGFAHDDSDEDGWVSRAEASAGAERLFARLDHNSDGKIDDSDRPPHEDFDMHVERIEDGDGVRIIRRGGGDRDVRVHRERDERRGHAPRDEADEHHSDREVVILRSGGGETETWMSRGGEGAVMAPHAPMPPHRPMFMTFSGAGDESDTNGDGAVSLDEFRAQQLRYFDANDANGDGRMRAPRMVRAPEPPAPPEPPRPPRRR